MQMNTDVVDRLYRYLATELERSRNAPYERPITVAEIYQDLAPYRNVRSVIGVEINQDYEHALMRLLAGEDGRVRLEPGTARGELERELRSANPNITLYRKYAACDVWVQPPEPGATASGPSSHANAGRGGDPWANAVVSTAPAGAETREGTPSGADEEPVDRVFPERDAAARSSAAPDADGPSAGSNRCSFCRAPLPAERDVLYCPRCGADQRTRPCPSCGEALQAGWQFCIRCGSRAEPLDASRA